MGLNNTIDQMDLRDIYRTFHPIATRKHILLKGTWSIIPDRSYVEPQNLNKYKKMEII